MTIRVSINVDTVDDFKTRNLADEMSEAWTVACGILAANSEIESIPISVNGVLEETCARATPGVNDGWFVQGACDF